MGDLDIYLEQTSSKPLNINFYCTSKNYKLFGYYSISASTGANSIKAEKEGKFTIEIKDFNSKNNNSNLYEVYLPQVHIKGTTMGKKLFNYKKNCGIFDKKNNLAALMKFNPDEKGFIMSMFSSKNKSAVDTVRGSILKYEDLTIESNMEYYPKKKSKEILKINGEWTDFLDFGEDEYWKIKDYKRLQIFQNKKILDSDSSLRKDLRALINNEEENAQIFKEELEEIQRNDRKLREKLSLKNSVNFKENGNANVNGNSSNIEAK